jgi:nickel-dependent lactate racemase
MYLELKYGTCKLPLNLPEHIHVDVFEPNTVACLEDPAASLHRALDAPLACPQLEEHPTPASAAIAVPDETRPLPVKQLLPPLLDRIFTAWPALLPSKVAIIIGGGLHSPADDAQQARILPEDLRGCGVVAHDARRSPMTSYGRTTRGTPIEINKAYADAEYKLVMGMVDPHQFVGFTGGSKGVTIGCASAAMIEANHRLLRDPAARAGNIENNPVRLDLNEAGERIAINMVINVVLNAAETPVAITAGAPVAAMREAARVTNELYGLDFDEPYDIVVASCGGHPKDICLYQAQKGLTAAVQCARPGGRIMLAAECGRGIGDDVYHDYVRRFPSPHALKKAFEAGPFKMGAHKAYLFARTLTRFNVVLHSSLDTQTLKECQLCYGELQSTMHAWITECRNPRVAVLKNANSSFFTQRA